MHDTVLLTSDGLEIYQSEIDILTDEYINTLPDPNNIYKSQCFNGLLLYIYNKLIKNIIISDNIKHDRKNRNNYALLDNIFFSVYLPLTYKYNAVPTLLSFCSFVRIDNRLLTEILNGQYRNGSTVNQDNTVTVQKWKQICESALESKAYAENSIGAIFGLKAAYRWKESMPELPENMIVIKQSAEQIKERYKSAELPILDNE